MFIPVWSAQGEDEGYLNLDTLDRFMFEFDPDSPDTYNLVAKSGADTHVYKVSHNTYSRVVADVIKTSQ